MLSHNHYFYILAKKYDASLTDKQIDEIYNLSWEFDGSTDSRDEKILLNRIKTWVDVIREDEAQKGQV